MISSSKFHCLHFTWKMRPTEGHEGINKGGSHDWNSDLVRALLSSFSKWRMEVGEHGLSPPSLPTQACEHLVTCAVHWGFNLYRVNKLRGNQAPLKCLNTVSSLSDQVIKRMSRCPWSSKMEPNLTGLQSPNGIQYILSLFTPPPFTTSHNLVYKL